MASSSSKIQSDDVTVKDGAQSCMDSFHRCLQKAGAIHPRELSLVEDQHTRFAVWAANMNVLSAGKGSLDHRLREAVDVKDIVVGLLQALELRIQCCE